MSTDLEIIKGSVADDPQCESLSMEVWLAGKQLLRLRRYSGDWFVTIMDTLRIPIEDFRNIVHIFEQFIVDENAAIAQEQSQRQE